MDNLARQTDPEVLRLERKFNAAPRRVFAAWIDAKQIAQWFGPRGFRMQVQAMRVAPEGKYRFGMTPPDGGQTRYIVGRYLEIEPNRKLVFSWAWQDDTACNDTHAPDDSLVTVRFYPDGDGTRIVLEHERLTSDESREGHRSGWSGSLDCLDEYLA